MAFVRDLFSGELVERPESGQGRQLLFVGALPYGDATVGAKRRKKAWHNRVNLAMSIKPEDVTAERVDAENELARKHGTGAFYDDRGRCHTEGRDIESKEMRRRGFQNNDAGFSDYAGR